MCVVSTGQRLWHRSAVVIAPPSVGRFVNAALVLGWVAWWLGCSPEPEIQAPASLPNVLLVSLDTLRADHLASYGYFRQTAPTLSEMAARGAQFNESYSQSASTVPTHASIFSGVLPTQHGTWGYKQRLSRSAVTIAEYLQDHGYRTFGVASSKRFAERSGFHQGFGSFDVLNEVTKNERSQRAVEIALGHMNQPGGGEPWFGFVHFLDTHGPYAPPEPFATRWHPGHEAFPPRHSMKYLNERLDSGGAVPPDILEYLIGLYDGAISYLDTHLERMFEELQPANGRSTLIVITSDHGEEFMENGTFLHARFVHEVMVRVPLLFVWPGRIAPGTKIRSAAQSVDLFPTILDLLDLPAVDGLPGRSHAAVLLGGEEPLRLRGEIRDVVLLQEKQDNWGIIATLETGRFKLEQNRRYERPRMYRLDQDPQGKKDLFPAFEEERGVLRRLYEGRLDAGSLQPDAEWERETPAPLTRQEIEELRALGYVEEAEQAEAELR
jgi:arylsulfatase